MRRKTLDQVAANYSSLLDGVMTVSRSQSFFLLPARTHGEPVGDRDELAPAKNCDAAGGRATSRAGARNPPALLQNCEGTATPMDG
ncbi:MAG: hypothetical protein JO141_06475 [Bradyrhizobium sp.]|nr:hypothetical protein [Bradyrhizobium sp.]